MVDPVPEIGDVLVSPPPNVTDAQALRIARERFGIDGVVSRLTSERDANFRITDAAERSFVLKIANPAERPAVTNLQTEALLHIERNDPGLPVPRVVRTNEGAAEIRLALGDGEPVVRMLTFLEGEPLHRVRAGEAQRAAIARALASLALALRDFEHPAAEHDLLWNIANARRLRPLLPAIADDPLRALAERAIDLFDREVEPALASLRRQVVHNDFNPHNILMDPAEHDRVCGILDFGDVVRTALIADVAVAASYLVEADGDPLDPIAAFAAAYHAVVPLTAAEIGVLFDLVSVRLVTTVAIASWRARRQPENAAYILRNCPPAGAALQRFADVDRAAARRRLLSACGMEGPP
ncbi:MAG TPA: phosphotransferase [Methylomirabilota bacterium]|nr:phosphotransferase [Methylomirabilota bacterium]